MDSGLNLREIVVRAVKLVITGVAVALAAYYIPSGRRLKLEEVLMIGVSAAAILAVLDVFAPSVGASARNGMGLGIGLGVSGVNLAGRGMM